MAVWHLANRHTNLPPFQGAWPDHVRVQSSSCCFPRELWSFVCPRASLSFDQWHVTRSPPIRKHVWVGRYDNISYPVSCPMTFFVWSGLWKVKSLYALLLVPRETVSLCSWESQCFLRPSWEKHWGRNENKTDCFLRGNWAASYSVYCYMAGVV